MLLNELPEDILVQVVKCAAYTYIHMAGDWQASLVLLSVCRQWRQLARPLIYGGMYIHYQDGDISSRATDETDMVEAVADPPLLLTNADLIAATGSASYVKYVDAYVYCHESPFDGLDMILDTLCGIQPCWPSVNKLAVDLEYSLRTPITNSTSPSPMKKEIGHIGDRLSQMMPNMQRLIMEGCGDSQIDSTLYETLANKYTGQLKVLECTNPIHQR
ncbi:hypothetical protein GGF46_000814 [Coemansia sp. RSA 552]|nr:hypothetical protein GGF46_000814 [Coemansia sp. RSA 552]